jgi:hypothetical protein
MAHHYSKTTVAVLQLLAELRPMNFGDLYAEAGKRRIDIRVDGLNQALAELANDYLAERVCEEPMTISSVDKWSITVRGRAKILAAAARNAFAADEVDVEIRRCRHREPQLPAAATVCLTEDELDDWWQEQDVEMKAHAFLVVSLGGQNAGDSHVDLSDLRIPVVGTIGDENKAVSE